MYARRKPKKTGAVAGRIKQMSDQAAAKGEKKYQSDLKAAQSQEAESKKLKEHKQEVNHSANQSNYATGYKRAGENARPANDVQTRKSSGMYRGSVPVAGTDDKKLYAKRNPIKGVRRSDAKASVKRSMIRKMRSATY